MAHFVNGSREVLHYARHKLEPGEGLSVMPLSVEQVRDWVDDASFSKGQTYHDRGAVFDTVREEDGPLRAKCRGSRSTAYEQEVHLSARGIASAQCTCPVGGDGRCKHVAAVLLAWIDKPAAFRGEKPVDDQLSGLNEEQLREALRLLLDRDRGLAWVLDAVADSGGSDAADVSPSIYYTKAMAGMPDEYGWRGTAGAAHAVGAVAGIGADMLKRKRFAHAAAAYAGAIEAAIGTYQNYHDEGEISDEIRRCVQGLGDCLERMPHEAAGRSVAIAVLAAVADFDAEMGGFGLSDDLPDIMRQHATPAERQALAERFRNALSKTGNDRDWLKSFLGGLIVDLEMDNLDDEGFLRLCRETGRTVDLVDRLLALKRDDEADREARKQETDYDLLRLADVYARHQRTSDYADMLAPRADRTKDSRVWEWLRHYWTKKRNFTQALDLARREFMARPGQDGFDACLALGQRCGQDLAEELLAWLHENAHYDSLLDILLNRNEYDRAADVFKLRAKKEPWGSYGGDLELADRFAAHRPDVAIVIYRDEARCAIRLRGRSNYAHGCGCLRKWRDTCRTPADRQAFNACHRELAAEAKALPALRDEMGKARIEPFVGE